MISVNLLKPISTLYPMTAGGVGSSSFVQPISAFHALPNNPVSAAFRSRPGFHSSALFSAPVAFLGSEGMSSGIKSSSPLLWPTLFIGGTLLFGGALVANALAKAHVRKSLIASAGELAFLQQAEFNFIVDRINGFGNSPEQPSPLRISKHRQWKQGFESEIREKIEGHRNNLLQALQKASERLASSIGSYETRVAALSEIFPEVEFKGAAARFEDAVIPEISAAQGLTLKQLNEAVKTVKRNARIIDRTYDWLPDYQKFTSLKDRFSAFLSRSEIMKDIPRDIYADMLEAGEQLDESHGALYSAILAELKGGEDIGNQTYTQLLRSIEKFTDGMFLDDVISLWGEHASDIFIMRPNDLPDPLILEGVLPYVMVRGDDGREMIVGYKGAPILHEGHDLTQDALLYGFSPILDSYSSVGYMAAHEGKLYLDNVVPYISEDMLAVNRESGARAAVRFLRHLGYDPRIFRVGSNVREMMASGELELQLL